MGIGAMGGLRTVGDIGGPVRETLRATLLRCHDRFSFYRRAFDAAGVSRENILRDDPTGVLSKLPVIRAEGLEELSNESVSVSAEIIDLETSSGTTGRRKRRFISYDDDASETQFLAELFAVCGIGGSDRVACLDTDPLTLMVSFTKALDVVGVDESYFYCVGPDFTGGLDSLVQMDPSVIVSVPSIVDRCFEHLRDQYARVDNQRLRAVVYAGEPMTAQLRQRLETGLGVEVFGYYGASETSALGIECRAHDGVHLFTDRNIVELACDSGEEEVGEVVVTTLLLETMPLLRYALGDVVALRKGACRCGLTYPRVEVRGRDADTVSVLGSKVDYESVRAAVYEDAGDTGFMQLVLKRGEREELTVVLPRRLEARTASARASLIDTLPDLAFLIDSGYVNLTFSFVGDNHFGGDRKLRRVVDLREEVNDTARR